MHASGKDTINAGLSPAGIVIIGCLFSGDKATVDKNLHASRRGKTLNRLPEAGQKRLPVFVPAEVSGEFIPVRPVNSGWKKSKSGKWRDHEDNNSIVFSILQRIVFNKSDS